MLSGGCQPVFCVLRDQPTFELRNGSKDMEHQLACSKGSIVPFLRADQIELSAFKLIDGFQPFLERSFKGRQSSREDKPTCDPTLLPFTSPLGWDYIILSGTSTGILMPKSAKLA